MSENVPLSNPGVRFPPPLLFVAGLVLGWALGRAGPWLRFAASGSGAYAIVGVGVIVVGVVLALSGILTFRAARTAIIPSHGASRLVTSGPYRFTRNPMYVGLTVAYVGAALLIGTYWPFLLLPVVLALLVRLVIRREEAYLISAFHDEYASYSARVRRWL